MSIAASGSSVRRTRPRKAGARAVAATRGAVRRFGELCEEGSSEESADSSAAQDTNGSDASWVSESETSADEHIDTSLDISDLARDITAARPRCGGAGGGKKSADDGNRKIQAKYRTLCKVDLFAKAADLADVNVLSAEQLATREGHIRMVRPNPLTRYVFPFPSVDNILRSGLRGAFESSWRDVRLTANRGCPCYPDVQSEEAISYFVQKRKCGGGFIYGMDVLRAG